MNCNFNPDIKDQDFAGNVCLGLTSSKIALNFHYIGKGQTDEKIIRDLRYELGDFKEIFFGDKRFTLENLTEAAENRLTAFGKVTVDRLNEYLSYKKSNTNGLAFLIKGLSSIKSINEKDQEKRKKIISYLEGFFEYISDFSYWQSDKYDSDFNLKTE